MAKILIVDDEPLERFTLKALLTHLSHTAVAAVDGKDGLDVLVRETPDLVILDFNMPDVDGYGFSRAVRTDDTYAQFRDIPLVGNGDFPEDKKHFLDECYEKGCLREPPQLNDVLIRQIARYDRLHDSRATYIPLVTRSIVQSGVPPSLFSAMEPADREERVKFAIRLCDLPPVRPYQLTILASKVSDAMRTSF